MKESFFQNYKKKSLKERFLFVIGMCFFLLYLVLGLLIIFWKELPLAMSGNIRLLFGVVLIVYASLRFVRFFNSNTDS
ncbi:MAG: hypothetical protein ACOVKJ_06325 [Flavobacterium sp.]|jgi:cytochrome c biogenesis protein CcdA